MKQAQLLVLKAVVFASAARYGVRRALMMRQAKLEEEHRRAAALNNAVEAIPLLSLPLLKAEEEWDKAKRAEAEIHEREFPDSQALLDAKATTKEALEKACKAYELAIYSDERDLCNCSCCWYVLPLFVLLDMRGSCSLASPHFLTKPKRMCLWNNRGTAGYLQI